jgi:hypothetical protein
MSEVDFEVGAPAVDVEEVQVKEAEAPKGKMSVEDALQVRPRPSLLSPLPVIFTRG